MPTWCAAPQSERASQRAKGLASPPRRPNYVRIDVDLGRMAPNPVRVSRAHNVYCSRVPQLYRNPRQPKYKASSDKGMLLLAAKFHLIYICAESGSMPS